MVVAGGDGTLLDTHPYIQDTPTMTVNTDSKRSDGALHMFDEQSFEKGLERFLSDSHELEEWTRVKARLEGEQEIALNEIYIGPEHTGRVSEYSIKTGSVEESHRNSGLIVSTGRGSTGWYQNIYRDLHGEERSYSPESKDLYYISWQNIDEVESPEGTVSEDEELVIRSEMNYNGAVKFDGHRRKSGFPRGREIVVKKAEPLRMVV